MSASIWEFNSTSPDPVRQQCVKEWEKWLSEVKSSKEKHRLARELKSDRDSEHFSATLELFFHHHFLAQGWCIEWHPALPDTTNKPEFRLKRDAEEILLEARIVEQEAQSREVVEFSEKLKAHLAKIPMPYEIFFDAWVPVPPLSLFDDVRHEIVGFVESEFERFSSEAESQKDVRWERNLRGTVHWIDFALYRQQRIPGPTLNVLYTFGGMSGMSKKLYYDIQEKANKYGRPDKPFVIVIWGLDHPEIFVEKAALYGNEAIEYFKDADGNVVGPVESIRVRNGLFTIREDGQMKHQHVSAVVFYQHKMFQDRNQHSLRVYHNPFALHPLGQSVFFLGYPQFVPAEGQMEWIPISPED